MVVSPDGPSSWTAHRWLSRYASVCCVLLLFTTISLTSFRKRMGASTIALSIGKENDVHGHQLLPEEEKFYKTTWPPLQRTLCSEGAPNLMLGTTLFRLAREEVFSNLTNSTFAPTRPVDWEKLVVLSDGKPSNLMSKFYAGDFGASIFHGMNAEGKPFVTLYAKIWKCGNNQIRWMEKKLFKHFNGTYDERPLWKALSNYLPKIYESQNMTPACIYTAVRDPISHFLSGYNEVEVRQLGEYNNQSSWDFPSKAKPAPYHVFVPYSSESPILRKKRFRAFVEDLLLEERVFSAHWIYSHFFSMSRILTILAKYSTKLTSYIPELNNITSTWPDFMANTCPNFPARDAIPKMTIQGQHRSSNDRLGLYEAAKEVWGEAGPISRSLCLIHAFDYACYKDLPDRIPILCQSVYQHHAETIIGYGNDHQFRYKKGENKPPPWAR